MFAGQIEGSGSGTDIVAATGTVDVSGLTLDGTDELEINRARPHHRRVTSFNGRPLCPENGLRSDVHP